jgi:hypothetical protein
MWIHAREILEDHFSLAQAQMRFSLVLFHGAAAVPLDITRVNEISSFQDIASLVLTCTIVTYICASIHTYLILNSIFYTQ